MKKRPNRLFFAGANPCFKCRLGKTRYWGDAPPDKDCLMCGGTGFISISPITEEEFRRQANDPLKRREWMEFLTS